MKYKDAAEEVIEKYGESFNRINADATALSLLNLCSDEVFNKEFKTDLKNLCEKWQKKMWNEEL